MKKTTTMLCLLSDNSKIKMLCTGRNERKEQIFSKPHLRKEFHARMRRAHEYTNMSYKFIMKY